MIMMSAINAERGLMTSQTSPLSKPRAVYSIDQILGNHHRRNTINGNFLLNFHLKSSPWKTLLNRKILSMLHIWDFWCSKHMHDYIIRSNSVGYWVSPKMIKLVRKQRNSPGGNDSYCYYFSNERGKLQPDITAKIIIISYFTVVYFKLGRFVRRKSFNSFLVNEMSCCVFKILFLSAQVFLEHFINENFIIWK